MITMGCSFPGLELQGKSEDNPGGRESADEKGEVKRETFLIQLDHVLATHGAEEARLL